jgi:hypothetical protein
LNDLNRIPEEVATKAVSDLVSKLECL